MESTPTPAAKSSSLAKSVLVTALALGGVLGLVTVAYADDPTPDPAAPAEPTGGSGGTGTSQDCPGMR
jgi:hypothetical protein